jgi:hypothetical protein
MCQAAETTAPLLRSRASHTLGSDLHRQTQLTARLTTEQPAPPFGGVHATMEPQLLVLAIANVPSFHGQ